VNFNAPSTAANTILPPGTTMLTKLTIGETLNFIRAGVADTELSIIIPK